MDYRIRMFNIGPYNDVIDELKGILTPHSEFVFDEYDAAGVAIRFRCEELTIDQINEIVRSAWGILKGYHRIAVQRRPVPPKGDILLYSSQFFKGEVSFPEIREPKPKVPDAASSSQQTQGESTC
jgi:hypothetical protein